MYLGTNGKFKFYAEEVSRCPPAKLERIGAACQRVEQDVWNAVESFSHYLTKQSALIYAVADNNDGAPNNPIISPGTDPRPDPFDNEKAEASDRTRTHTKFANTGNPEIVGFALFDLSIKSDTLVVAANECMVLRQYQGHGLPTLFMVILTSHIRKDNRLRRKKRTYNSITFVSSTVSFKLMAAFRRYAYLANKSSFDPDRQIRQIAQDYMQKESWELISEDNLFFVKGAFPNAVKLKPGIQRPDFVPHDFVCERGDAFLFVCRINNFFFLHAVTLLTLLRYGYSFSKRLIPISRISRATPEQTIYTR